MNISKPIFWHQGQLLQPQHFQLADLHVRSLLNPYNKYLQPFFWGVISLSIREEQLNTETFGINDGQFLFPDGTYSVLPGNTVIAPRSFANDWDENKKSFTIYLGLHKLNAGGENVSIIDNPEHDTTTQNRFVTSSSGDEIFDIYSDGPSANVKRLKYMLRIIWETEEESFNDYDLIPIAELTRNGKDIILSKAFFPPTISAASNDRLRHMIHQSADLIASRCAQLEHGKSTSTIKSGNADMAEWLQFAGLTTVADSIAGLTPLLEDFTIHPWIFYREFVHIIGKLSIFSTRVSATGKNADGTEVIPPYNHTNLYNCFVKIQRVIAFLLDEIVLGTENVIILKNDGSGYYSNIIDKDLVSENYRYYLIVRGNNAHEVMRDNILTMSKLASRATIQEVARRFVGGVPIDYISYPPAGVPSISGAVYFHINERSEQWKEVLKSGSVVLYTSSAPADFEAQIAVQKNQ